MFDTLTSFELFRLKRKELENIMGFKHPQHTSPSAIAITSKLRFAKIVVGTSFD
jgi:hypothetical protein